MQVGSQSRCPGSNANLTKFNAARHPMWRHRGGGDGHKFLAPSRDAQDCTTANVSEIREHHGASARAARGISCPDVEMEMRFRGSTSVAHPSDPLTGRDLLVHGDLRGTLAQVEIKRDGF